MSSTITYKGNTLTTVNNQTRVLNTRGTWLEDDITIVDVTSSSVSGSAISVVDTTDSKGGTVRTITSVDISDTTAVASDVAQGKYFYTANGTKTAGTATGGGSVASWETLYDNSTTISSGDPNWATLVYNEPFSANETYRITWGTNGTQYICQTAASPDSRVYDGYFIGNPSLTGQYTDTGEPFFMYRASATQLNIVTNQSAGTIYIKIEKQVSSSGATLITKTITINGTYDADDDSADGFSSVTVNVPSANLTTKTITTNGTYRASTDNVDGYSEITVNVSGGGGGSSGNDSYETVFFGTVVTYANRLFNISELADYYPAEGETYRITIDGDESICETVYYTDGSQWMIGNTDVVSGENDAEIINNSNVENFVIFNSGWGGLYGFIANSPDGTSYALKIEKLVNNSSTAHTIYFEYLDGTNTTISVNYSDSIIGTMITSYKPTIHNNKYVGLAQLDGVTWYSPAAIPLNTELIDYSAVSNDTDLQEDGTTISAQWYGVSDYTMIDPTMTFSYKGLYWGRICFYDETRTFISYLSIYNDGEQVEGSNNTGAGTLTPAKMPATARYVRIATLNNADSSILSLIRTA